MEKKKQKPEITRAKITVKAINIEVEGDPGTCLDALRGMLAGLLALPEPPKDVQR